MENLRIFQNIGERIRGFMKENEKSIEQLSGEWGISRVSLSRIINGHNKPNSNTLEKIAKGLGLIEIEPILIKNDNSKNTLKIGSGGLTVYPANLIAALFKNQLERDNIQICFAGEIECGKSVPKFINTKAELMQYLSTESGQNVDNRYFARNLKRLIEDEKIDAFMMARNSFDELFTPKDNLITICRLMVGYAVYLTIIKLKEGNEQNIDTDLADLVDAKNNVDTVNFPYSLKDAKGRSNAVEKIKELLRKKKLGVGCVKQTIVERLFNDFLKDELIDIKSQWERGNPEFDYDISEPNEIDFNKVRTEILNNKDFSVVIVSFEPLNHIFYNKLVNFEGNDYSNKIIYYNYNLSKIMGQRLSYCLYAKKETLNNPEKFREINTFVDKIQRDKEGGKRVLQDEDFYALTKFFFPEEMSTDKKEKHRRIVVAAIKQLDFSNNTADFINFMAEKMKS